MARKLVHSMNKNILVVVPSLFGDHKIRSCKLLEIEPYGLWLECSEVPKEIYLEKEKLPSDTNITVFVPFAQITCVLDTTSSAKAAMRAAMARATQSGARAPSHKKPPTSTKISGSDVKPKEKKGQKPRR